MDETLVRALITQFRDALNNRETELYSENFIYPHIIWNRGEPFVINTPEECQAHCQGLIERFEAAGLNYSSEKSTSFSCEGDQGMAVVEWRMYDDTGIEKHCYTIGYYVVRTKAGWRIALIRVEPPNLTESS